MSDTAQVIAAIGTAILGFLAGAGALYIKFKGQLQELKNKNMEVENKASENANDAAVKKWQQIFAVYEANFAQLETRHNRRVAELEKKIEILNEKDKENAKHIAKVETELRYALEKISTLERKEKVG